MRIVNANRFIFITIAVAANILIISGASYASSDKPGSLKSSSLSVQSEYNALNSYLSKISPYRAKYSFCNNDRNSIQNDSLGMPRFFQKLTALRQGKINRVNIVQIGDSHLQSGFISNEVRNGMQGFFGDTGRGLVFPFRTVGVGEAYDINLRTQGWKSGDSSTRTYTVKKGDTKSGIAHRFGRSLKSLNRLNPGLVSKKILKPGDKLSVGNSYKSLAPGFCGYALKTISNQNSITVKTIPEVNAPQKFNMLSLLLGSTDAKLNIVVTDGNGNLLKKTTIEQLPKEFNSVPLMWNQPVNSVQIKVSGLEGVNPAVILYGITLERTQHGVMYHSIGLNGAGFERYNKNAQFFTQLAELNPDLLIISLGTNDAMGTFRRNVCEKSMNEFIRELRKALPNTEVLMTTPPDSYKVTRKGKVENQAIPQVRDLIRDIAVQNGFAWWNLYEIMGGSGSMKKWVNSGLAQHDHKHFNASGYREQGYLLRDSILNGYASYVARLDK